MPTSGVAVLHEVRFLTQRCSGLHSYVRGWVGAQGGQRLPIRTLGVSVRIVDVDVNAPSVVLAIDQMS